MKNLIFILSLLLTLGCGSRKANSKKTEKRQETKTEQKQQTAQKTDSTAKKQETKEEQTSTKTQSSSWKYTAPQVQIRDSVRLIDAFKPFWLKINGDSINLAGLPAGSSLESRSESTETLSWMQHRIDALTKLNKELETKAELKQEAKIIEREKIKEVERQSVQWALVIGALLLGMFLPSIFKAVWGFALAQIPFLSKFKK